jgi:hypothetical protein
MPLCGVSKADLFFEMYVNGYCTRGLALFSDIREVSYVGSVRSLRYNFTELCQIYDAIVFHASASNQVLIHRDNAGIDYVNVESEAHPYHFRHEGRRNEGYAWEHCLFVRGQESWDYIESKEMRNTRPEDADYGLRFTEDGTPADGEDANNIHLTLIHGPGVKKNILKYSPEEGKYLFHQFNMDMFDGSENQYVYFENVIIMLCRVYDKDVYHVADLVGSGEGYFACNGKIIPIKWVHENLEDPILFTLEDGTPLELGVGNSYIAIAPLTSTVEWE